MSMVTRLRFLPGFLFVILLLAAAAYFIPFETTTGSISYVPERPAVCDGNPPGVKATHHHLILGQLQDYRSDASLLEQHGDQSQRCSSTAETTVGLYLL